MPYIKTTDIHVVFEVVDFDHVPDWILLGASHKILVSFSLTFGHGKDAIHEIDSTIIYFGRFYRITTIILLIV